MRTLDYDMLNIVIAVQRLKSFMIADSAIREAAGQESPSWFETAYAYYSESPDSVMRLQASTRTAVTSRRFSPSKSRTR